MMDGPMMGMLLGGGGLVLAVLVLCAVALVKYLRGPA